MIASSFTKADQETLRRVGQPITTPVSGGHFSANAKAISVISKHQIGFPMNPS